MDRGYAKVEESYLRLLAYALGHRMKILLLAFGIFFFSLFITKFIGKEFTPSEDQSRVSVRLQAPVDYSIDEIDRMFFQAEQIIRGFPEVKTLFYAQGFFGASNKGNMFVGFVPKAERKKNQEQLKAEIRKSLRQKVPGLKAGVEDISLIGGGIRNVPIQYVLRGRDLAAVEASMNRISGEFSRLPGIVDVDTSLEAGKPEVRVFINRDKAADLGVEVAAVAEAVNVLVGGEADVTKYKDAAKGRRYDVRVRLDPADRFNPRDIEKIAIRSKDGRLVELSSIVEIQEAGGPSVINRVDRQRAIMMFANLEGMPLGQAKGELDAIAAKTLPPDQSTAYRG
ncbi:MAG: efflux RND transporter permease subunit, partial [Candidatus Dadabacteria bacterium]